MTAPTNTIDRISEVRLFAFDVDGVLTDGGIYLGTGGFEMKRFNAQDGAGIAVAKRSGYPVIIITGRESEAVARRCEELKIQHLYQGVKDKVALFEEVIGELGYEPRQALYMGDDLPDLPLLRRVGLATCPQNAVQEVKEDCQFIARNSGGNGAVREVIEMVMRNQGRWGEAVQEYFAERVKLDQ